MANNKDKSDLKTTKKPTPSVLSINVCDTILRDQASKKVSLIGLFSTIRANSFPCTHPLMHIYIALTNGHGSYQTEVRFVSLHQGKPIVGMKGNLNFQNPLQVIELNLCWQRLSFEKPGEYEVEVLCDDTSIGARKFRVIGPQQEIPPTSGTEMR